MNTARPTSLRASRPPSAAARGRHVRFGRFLRGVETVELAVSLPVLLFVLFAGFELGWALLRSIQIDHAARVGAREAALYGSTAASVQSRVLENLQGSGIDTATITIDPADPSVVVPGEAISVEIVVDYSDVELLGLSGLMPLPESLSGRASMVKEPDS